MNVYILMKQYLNQLGTPSVIISVFKNKVDAEKAATEMNKHDRWHYVNEEEVTE